MMRLFTRQGHINWYTYQIQMATKMEPKYFKIEKSSKDTIEKLYQAGLMEFLKMFNSHNNKIT